MIDRQGRLRPRERCGMAGGGWKRAAADVVVGWRADEPIDVVPCERQGLKAMLTRAWLDLRLETNFRAKTKRDEALAAKLSAYDWVQSDAEHFMSFRWVCLLLGKNAESTRRLFLQGIKRPGGKMPPQWEAEFASTDRQDRTYVKRKNRDLPPSQPMVPGPPVPAEDRFGVPYTLENLMSALDSLVENAPAEDEVALAASGGVEEGD